MNGKIPAARPDIGEEEKEAVMEVLESGQIAMGPKVKEFEEKFASYIGVEEAVAVSSGTAALHLSLLAAGVGIGDEVIVTPYSFFSSVSMVMAVGAVPVFVDIDKDTFCVDPEKIEDKVSDDTKAILPVHLYGHPAEMGVINGIAEEKGLIVIEDACQAHGAEYNGVKVGGIGDMGCFSFYATKNMITGEGGMVTADDHTLANEVRKLREHGRVARGRYTRVGYNYLMTDVEAAIGIVQLGKLDEMNEKRRENAERLNNELQKLEEENIVKTPLEKENCKHVYHQYALRVPSEKRNRIIASMQKAGIQVRTGYEVPIYEQEAIGLDAECPETVLACDEVIWLPIHHLLEGQHVSRMAWGLEQFLL
ncbi:MAG: DegT/DnrJ/EryC1/StrS family aminotransferase [Thermoplasmata archaeon]